MTYENIEKRIESLEGDRLADGTAIEFREEVVSTPWEPDNGEAPELGTETFRVVLE